MPPRTIPTPGNGTNTVTVELPEAVDFDLQSVLVAVDNTAGGDAIAEIVLADPSGQVIQTHAQSAPIPAGDTGTATFARRLPVDGGASGGGGSGQPEFFEQSSQTVHTGVPTNLVWTHVSGPILLDTFTPTAPTFIAAGVYAVTLTTLVFGPAGGKSAIIYFGIGIAAAASQSFPLGPIGSPSIPAGSVSTTFRVAAGTALGVALQHDAGVNKSVDMFAYVAKLSD